MKNWWLVCLISFPIFGFYSDHKHFDLTVKVTDVKGKEGIIEFALYKDPEKFPKVGKTYRLLRIENSGNSVSATFTDVPEGKYAVCLYHDKNSNNKCDKNLLGIPTEGYGFSNNKRPVFSAPSFEDCSFKLVKDKTITISMVN